MKKILSFVTLMALTATLLVGCGDKPPKNPEDWTDKDFENAANQLEEQYEKEKKESKKAETETPVTTAPEVEEVVYAPTEEIINADFRSGLFQFNNDIFQQGGYITVADFVEKYSDRYDISYRYTNDNGIAEYKPYEECKDYLVSYSYVDKFKLDCPKFIELTPKYGDKSNTIKAHVINVTSPDEKITLDKAVVLFYKLAPSKSGEESHTPAWTPKGFKSGYFFIGGMGDGFWVKPNDVESENKNYNKETFKKLLEDNGFEYKEGSSFMYDWKSDQNKYKIEGDEITFLFAGETNLFGVKPFYICTAYFNPDTDKLKEVNYNLERFIREE